MKRNAVLVSLVVLGLVLVLLGGCVSKSEHESLQNSYETLEKERNNLMEEGDNLAIRIAGLGKDLEEAQITLVDLQDKYSKVSDELSRVMEVYPPGDFSSVTGLERWVLKHIQPKSPYLDGTFRSALEVQSQGLEDGYLISVMYDEYDIDPTLGWVWCGALINGHLYIWDPEVGEIYNWYADWLVR